MDSEGHPLFAFVRFWSRRWTGTDRGRDVMVVEAVHALARVGNGNSDGQDHGDGPDPGEHQHDDGGQHQRPARPVAINDIAHELGVDQSGASRMVARAERHHLLSRQTPDHIGAKASIAVTAAGVDLLRHAHAWQDEVVRSLTADWPAEDVETLLTLMGRLVAAQTRQSSH